MSDIRGLVGRNVARIRRERQMTQEQLSERSGLSQQYLSTLERGSRNPTVTTLDEVAKALSVKVIDLLSPTGE